MYGLFTIQSWDTIKKLPHNKNSKTFCYLLAYPGLISNILVVEIFPYKNKCFLPSKYMTLLTDYVQGFLERKVISKICRYNKIKNDFNALRFLDQLWKTILIVPQLWSYSNYFPDENVTLMSTWTIYNIITLGDIKNKNNYDGNDNFNDNFYSKLTANYDINNATIV